MHYYEKQSFGIRILFVSEIDTKNEKRELAERGIIPCIKKCLMHIQYFKK